MSGAAVSLTASVLATAAALALAWLAGKLLDWLRRR